MQRIWPLLLLAPLGTAPALAQADSCANATALGSGATSATFDTNVCADTGAPATTSAQQYCANLSDDVWFRWTAAVTGVAVFATCNNATFDTEIAVWHGASCGAMTGIGCNDDFAALCTASTSWLQVPVTAGDTYYVQVGHWNGTSGDVYGAGTLTVTNDPDPCAGAADDAFEPNDTCASASVLAAGTHTGLFLSETDPDHYRITIPAGFILEATVTDAPTVDVELALADAGCVPISGGTGDFLSFENRSGGPLDVVLECAWNPLNPADTCLYYDLDIVFTPDPCAVYPVDSFEPNFDCPTAAPISDGTYPGLSVFEWDQDYYAVNVADGDTLTVDIYFTDAVADLDLYLWDLAVSCDTNLNGIGANGSPLDFSWSATDDESAMYTNISGQTQTVVIEIDVYTPDGCSDYEMVVFGSTGGGSTPGTAFCPGLPNSTGSAGVTTASGQTAVAANDFTLHGSDLPPGQFGIFVVSDAQVAPISVFSGLLCLGGNLGRFTRPNQIWQVSTLGESTLPIDLNLIPRGAVFVQTQPGETLYFQAWHRDFAGGAPTSNFTTGTYVTFN